MMTCVEHNHYSQYSMLNLFSGPEGNRSSNESSARVKDDHTNNITFIRDANFQKNKLIIEIIILWSRIEHASRRALHIRFCLQKINI